MPRISKSLVTILVIGTQSAEPAVDKTKVLEDFMKNSDFRWRKAYVFLIKALQGLAGSQDVICHVDMCWRSCLARVFALNIYCE